MPYKIVQTLEGGVPTLSVVPALLHCCTAALWDSKGVLRWPPTNTKYPMKLLRDEHSRPGPGWVTLECILKRNNIRNYEDANRELGHMEQKTDTDNQENECMNFSGPPKTCQAKENEVNFEAMAENLTYSQPGAYELSMKNFESVQEQTLQVVEQQATVQIISTENSDTMLANQTLILNKLNLILENQKKFGQKLASLSVQLDETNESIRQLQQEQQCNVTLLKDASSEERESFSLKAVETKEDFEMFELTLADKVQRKKLVKCLSTLYSYKKGEGQTCAYKLLDILFTKDFLCQCSWSGGSKSEHSKIPMKDFTKFRKFFFEIVHMWDPNFTDDQMISFFKLVLRNANKRKSMQGLRESTKRVRKSRKLIVPEGNTDGVTTQFEINNSITTEEGTTDDNDANLRDGNRNNEVPRE